MLHSVHMNECLFCKFAAGEIPCHRVWEGDAHLAFLTIFPNTEGVTVVIPKAHLDSYIFAVDDAAAADLLRAAKTVARKLESAFPDIARVGVVFEGFGIDHLHAKLYPLHGTKAATAAGWKPLESGANKAYYETYPGFISSNDSDRVDDAVLAQLAERVRQAGKG